MSEATISPLPTSARAGVLTYLAISALVFVLMMALGVLMRVGQADWLWVPPDIF